ncbi:hypothetical protein KO566_13055 [Flavobacteriaceae bacterium XHP0103]|uniref:hypothetical protein n=1 Tax=Marixanthotalea marina TaxID=2844359 RepID=UPI002989F028|nr:hypothetical protein [Marixanthotalea marina]MBU3822993.1 hypothetical protein [Marixanthotalea marina]
MKFESSRYYKLLKSHKIQTPYGDFYFCDKFYLAEIYEGVHLDYGKIKNLMSHLVDFYGDKKIGFISNRINSYSIDPHLYSKIDEEFDKIVASAFVTYTNISYMNATMEKRFSKKSIKRCMFLDEAIDWVLNIKELKT